MTEAAERLWQAHRSHGREPRGWARGRICTSHATRRHRRTSEFEETVSAAQTSQSPLWAFRDLVPVAV